MCWVHVCLCVCLWKKSGVIWTCGCEGGLGTGITWTITRFPVYSSFSPFSPSSPPHLSTFWILCFALCCPLPSSALQVLFCLPLNMSARGLLLPCSSAPPLIFSSGWLDHSGYPSPLSLLPFVVSCSLSVALFLYRGLHRCRGQNANWKPVWLPWLPLCPQAGLHRHQG